MTSGLHPRAPSPESSSNIRLPLCYRFSYNRPVTSLHSLSHHLSVCYSVKAAPDTPPPLYPGAAVRDLGVKAGWLAFSGWASLSDWLLASSCCPKAPGSPWCPAACIYTCRLKPGTLCGLWERHAPKSVRQELTEPKIKNFIYKHASKLSSQWVCNFNSLTSFWRYSVLSELHHVIHEDFRMEYLNHWGLACLVGVDCGKTSDSKTFFNVKILHVSIKSLWDSAVRWTECIQKRAGIRSAFESYLNQLSMWPAWPPCRQLWHQVNQLLNWANLFSLVRPAFSSAFPVPAKEHQTFDQ